MGEELTDIEINLAQQLLKCQFPEVNGLQSTLLQDKQTLLTERSVNDKIQIIHCKRRHHWVVATTMNCNIKFLILFILSVPLRYFDKKYPDLTLKETSVRHLRNLY